MTEEHRPECYETFALPRKCVVCAALRDCEERVARAFKQLRADDRQRSYHRGFDDARWIAAKESLEAVQHEEPCDCEPCKAVVRALAELRTIGND